MDEDVGMQGTDPGAPEGLTKDERTWAMIAVLSPLVGFAVPIPFVNIIAPLILYFVKREESAFVAFHALQSVYFQIVVFIAAVICIILIFVCIGVPLLIVVGLGSIAYMVVIAIKAYNGEWAEFWMAGDWARNSMER
jgi:uncharacterized Tic20 family protein